jgi:MipA family protein
MNTARLFFYLYTSVACLVLSPGTRADDDPQGWQVSIGVGAGVRTNPVMDNSNIPMIVIPQVNYQGERFFLQNLDVGYELWSDDQQKFSLLLTPSYDQIFFHHWQAATFVSTLEANGALTKDDSQPTVELLNRTINKRQLHERRMAALGGLEYSFQSEAVDIQLQALHELTDYYQGDELRIALSKTINFDRSEVKLTLGANWQSDRSLDYFYGVRFTEAPAQEYHPSSGVTALMRFDWSYQLDAHWSLRFFTSYRRLGSAIADSPLTTSDNVVTAFAGGVYHF